MASPKLPLSLYRLWKSNKKNDVMQPVVKSWLHLSVLGRILTVRILDM
jgi:hypothetical protein